MQFGDGTHLLEIIFFLLRHLLLPSIRQVSFLWRRYSLRYYRRFNRFWSGGDRRNRCCGCCSCCCWFVYLLKQLNTKSSFVRLTYHRRTRRVSTSSGRASWRSTSCSASWSSSWSSSCSASRSSSHTSIPRSASSSWSSSWASSSRRGRIFNACTIHHVTK